jgi:hypothetical protein
MKVGFWFIIVGLFIWFLNLGFFSFFNFGRDWPLILVFVGIIIILDQIITFIKGRGKKYKEKEKGVIEDVISDLESGKIDVKEAIKKIKKGEK